MLASLRRRAVFYGELLRATREVGAFSFTSRAAARVVAEPIAALPPPRRVLEVGPGTGALTAGILEQLGRGDRLELLEINERFVRLLRSELAGIEGPSIEVIQGDVEAIPDVRYDVIVSSLPLMNFEPEKVRRILALYARHIDRGTTLGVLDYWGRELRRLVAGRVERRRLTQVLDATEDFIGAHAHVRRVVVRNFPPAVVHFVRSAQAADEPPGS